MKNVAVVGLGKVGSLVGTLLSDRFVVSGFDQNKPATDVPFEVTLGSIKDISQLETFLATQDAVVSCLPYKKWLIVESLGFAFREHNQSAYQCNGTQPKI